MAITAPQHFLYFLPLPQGHGSLRPTGMCDEGLEGASSILAEYLATAFLHPENSRLARLSRSPPVAPARYKPARRKDGGLALGARRGRLPVPGGNHRRALRGISATACRLRGQDLRSHRRAAADRRPRADDVAPHPRTVRGARPGGPHGLRDACRAPPYLPPRLHPPPDLR